MAWTTPKTNWAVGELVTAEDMNAIGENLATLRDLQSAAFTTTVEIRQAASREFSDVDSDNLNLAITTSGGDVLVHFHGSILHPQNSSIYLDVEVDGARLGGTDGILQNQLRYISNNHAGASKAVGFTHLIQDLSAGSHTFKLQSKGGKPINLKTGAQFWVREI